MNSGIDNNIDWTVPSTPGGDRVGPGLKKSGSSNKPNSQANTKRAVMDKLLGENNLAAYEAGGKDPYNTTGKRFRR